MPLEKKILTSANDIDLIKPCSLLDACLLFRFIPWHPEPFLLKLMNQNEYQAHLGIFSHISGLVLQKQASETRITYHITQILCDIITCLCPRFLLHRSSYTYICRWFLNHAHVSSRNCLRRQGDDWRLVSSERELRDVVTRAFANLG